MSWTPYRPVSIPGRAQGWKAFPAQISAPHSPRAAAASSGRSYQPFEILLAVAVLSLLSNLRVHVGATLRPFDFLVAITGVLFFLGGAAGRTRLFPTGALLLLPYFFCHALSAASLGLGNGLRETVQVGIVVVFATVLAAILPYFNYPRLGRFMLNGLLLIMAIMIAWHIAHGHTTGWKLLDEPKAAFTFLPMTLSLFLIYGRKSMRYWYWLLWAGLFVVLVLSGERKALIVYGLLTAACLSRGRFLLAIPVVAVFVAGLTIVAATSDSPYLTRHVNEILNPTSQSVTYEDIQAGVPVDSLSDAQRAFQARIGREMIKRSPLFGVGTNGYQDLIQQRFAFLPDYMQVGIHGEFLRVAVENGLVGLVLYLLVWICSFVRTVLVLRKARQDHIITRAQADVTPVLFFTPCAFYLAFEATGAHSFVVLILLSLLPEFIMAALAPRRRKAAALMQARPA
jgi:hypothetical protein